MIGISLLSAGGGRVDGSPFDPDRRLTEIRAGGGYEFRLLQRFIPEAR